MQEKISIRFTDYVEAYRAMLLAKDGAKKIAERLFKERSCPLSPYDVVGIWHTVIGRNSIDCLVAMVEEIIYYPETGETETVWFEVTRKSNYKYN